MDRKKSLTTDNFRHQDFTGKFYQIFKREIIPILHKHFRKQKNKNKFPTHFKRPAVYWYQKHGPYKKEKP